MSKFDESDARLQEQGDLFLVTSLAMLCSLVAFGWYYRHGDILLYGDAVAHINIARRLIDARTLSAINLGTVWLPLPHLLMAPFVAFHGLWQTGVGGSLPSMAAYVLGIAGLFRLVRARASRGAAWLAATIYALNPSLLYMQATAMTESIFLAAVIWAVYYFDRFRRALDEDDRERPSGLPAWRALERCGLCLAAAIFTRYDGWILAFIIGLCAAWCGLDWLRLRPAEQQIRRLRRSIVNFLLLLALCPTLWLAHNHYINRHPLDWLNGPYSAKAIEQRTSQPGAPPYPGKGTPIVAAEYFLKAARMNTGEGPCEYWLLTLATAGMLAGLWYLTRFGSWLLLWIPLPFYAWSVAYGSVPIFVPEWWPYGHYNVRYGLELLPAIAASAALLPWLLSQLRRRALSAAGYALLWIAMLAACVSSAAGFSPRARQAQWGRHWMIPICYREAYVNSRGRLRLEHELATDLAALPHRSTILMNTSEFVGALQQAGVPLRRVLNDCNGIEWEAAQSAPYESADFVVTAAGDPIAKAVARNPRGLELLAVYHTLGEPEIRLYQSVRR